MNRQNKYLRKQKSERQWVKTSKIIATCYEYVAKTIAIHKAMQALRKPIPRYPEAGQHPGGIALVGSCGPEVIVLSDGIKFQVPDTTLPDLPKSSFDLPANAEYSDAIEICKMYYYPVDQVPTNNCTVQIKAEHWRSFLSGLKRH